MLRTCTFLAVLLASPALLAAPLCPVDSLECAQAEWLKSAEKLDHTRKALSDSEKLNDMLSAENRDLTERLSEKPSRMTWFGVGLISGCVLTVGILFATR